MLNIFSNCIQILFENSHYFNFDYAIFLKQLTLTIKHYRRVRHNIKNPEKYVRRLFVNNPNPKF